MALARGREDRGGGRQLREELELSLLVRLGPSNLLRAFRGLSIERVVLRRWRLALAATGVSARSQAGRDSAGKGSEGRAGGERGGD